MKEQEFKALLGRNVKFLRAHCQFSQADLADKAQISITYLSNIERGNTFPKARTLLNLAKNLQVDVYELFKPEIVPEEHKDVVGRLTEAIRTRVNQTLDQIFAQYSQ
ncbi:MAG: helix-turn-helix domain-containing protein [Spirochaetaceae bacterium]|jgi:transcriptional regulator with XRE-family HTH domain|nr:helix-turn-helix domain-containing protein [Spirochaetaceae bacterium]